jgi:hypothetical protein
MAASPRRHFRCTPWLAAAPACQSGTTSHVLMYYRASHRPQVTRASGVAGGRTHHELPARRARNVLASSTPLTADPALLEGRPRRGGLVRARIQPRAGIQRRHLRSASTSCVAYAGATFAFVFATLSPPWPARPHGLLCKVHTTDPDAIVSACLLPRPVGMLTVAALQVFAALSARDQCSGMCMSMAAICQPRSPGPRQNHLPIPARKLRAR